MGTVSRVHTFSSGAILTAAQLNNEFDNLLTSSAINGGLDATNLGVTAGQATASKALVVDGSRNLADGTAGNRINNLALSGTFESTGGITATAGITSGGNIVSDTDSTDDLGTTSVRWANLYADSIGDSGQALAVKATTLSFDAASTIDTSGNNALAISTGSANLNVTAATLALTGAQTISSTLGVTGLITASGGVSGNISGNVTGGTISGTTGTFSGDVAVDTDTLFVDVSEDRVGIGLTAPRANLQISNGATTSNEPGNTIAIFSNTAAADAITRVGIYAGGASAFSVLDFARNDGNERASVTYNTSAGTLGFDTNSDGDDLIIDNGGRVLIGFGSSQGSAYKLQVNSQIYATSATVATSDQRFKENVQSLTGATELINALNPVQFDWKSHTFLNFDTENTQLGFIAQEVQTALSGTDYVNSIVKAAAVTQTESTDVNGNVIPAIDEAYLGIAEGNMIALLTAALKETIARVDVLEG